MSKVAPAVSTVNNILADCGLEAFSAKLKDEGYATEADLKEADDADLVSDVGMKKPQIKRLRRYFKDRGAVGGAGVSTIETNDANETYRQDEMVAVAADVQDVFTENAADILVDAALSTDLAKDLVDVAGAVTESVLAVAEQIPMFGPLVKLLTGLKAASDQAQNNSDNCKQVGLWAGAIKTALVMAAPAINQADTTGVISELLDQVALDVKALLDMTDAYSRKGRLLRMATSRTFKNRFDNAKKQSKSMLDALQLCMQGVQLQMQQNGGGGGGSGLTAGDMKALLEQHASQTEVSSSISISMDAKLDTMLENQQKMMDDQSKQLEAQGKTNVKVDVLLDMVADIDPTNAPRSLQFSISGTIQQLGCADPCFRVKIFTKCGTATAWSVVQEELSAQEVLSQEEYTWLGKFLGAGTIGHDFGNRASNSMLVVEMGPRIEATLAPKLISAVDRARQILELEDREIQLKLASLELNVMALSAHFEIKWPAQGPAALASTKTITLPEIQTDKEPRPFPWIWVALLVVAALPIVVATVITETGDGPTDDDFFRTDDV